MGLCVHYASRANSVGDGNAAARAHVLKSSLHHESPADHFVADVALSMAKVITLNPPLSRREERALIRAFQLSAANDYPNPDRTGCPKGVALLKGIATKKLAPSHPIIQHVAECSPCFREMMHLRRDLNTLRFLKMAAATLTIALMAVLIKKR
jgi:hypothetical protein